MSNIKFGTFSLDGLEKHSEDSAALSESKFMTLAEGENILRFFPPEPGAATPFLVAGVHYLEDIPGIEGGKAIIACARQTLREVCPICEFRSELERHPNALERKRAAKFRAAASIYANVLDRKQPDFGPKVLRFGVKINDQLKLIRRSTRMGGDFTDPGPGGMDIIITRVGSGQFDTSYTVVPDRQCSPLAATDAEVEALWNVRHNLAEVLKFEIPAAVAAVIGHHQQPPSYATKQLGSAPSMPRVGASFARTPAPSAANAMRLDEDGNVIT